jgi:hypothetical protein
VNALLHPEFTATLQLAAAILSFTFMRVFVRSQTTGGRVFPPGTSYCAFALVVH